MRPTSSQFDLSLRDSHVIAARCELRFPGETDWIEVPVQAGSVRIDRTAQHRRTGTVTIPWSLQAGADLGLDLRTLALGGYARLHRGLRYASGDLELILLGTLRVESVSWNTLEASAQLELADGMAQVRDEPFTAPFAAAGLRSWEAAVEIVAAVFGTTIDYLTPFMPDGVLGDTIYTGDRGQALTDLEQGYGAETYFDAEGAFVFAAKPADDAEPVWTIDAGRTGVMIDAGESLDRTGIYNGVLAQGQASGDDPPFAALATFDDPDSPLRWAGPFGKVALLVDSSAATVEQAAIAAQNLLRLRLKQTRSLELTAAPNPALEAGDTILVVFPDGRREPQLVDAVEIDLGTAAQRIITRDQLAAETDSATVDPLFYGRQAWRELADARLVPA